MLLAAQQHAVNTFQQQNPGMMLPPHLQPYQQYQMQQYQQQQQY